MASDPYGLVGDRDDVNRADYDQHRDWDGMDALHRGLADASEALGRNGVDVRILEGGAATLGDLIATRRERLATLEATITQRRRLLLDLDACLSAGRALQAAARDRLATGFVSFVARAVRRRRRRHARPRRVGRQSEATRSVGQRSGGATALPGVGQTVRSGTGGMAGGHHRPHRGPPRLGGVRLRFP